MWSSAICLVLLSAPTFRASFFTPQAAVQQPFFDMLSRKELSTIIEQFRPDLGPFEEVYRDLHRNPELSLQESRTASIAAAHLRNNGYKVITDIGGYGLVGVLRNGNGPTVLLRADMDALPIFEETGLSYASRKRAIDYDGREKPVMHACGHDTHVTCMMAASSLLYSAKESWSGTLIILFQPNEEHGGGAQAMVDDGLYDKVPRPDIVLGQHLQALRTGAVAIRSGVFMAADDSFKITIYGRGGHSARPQLSIDPVVLASYIIVRLQGVVSREIAPTDVASVTCASIHGGEAENVIPDQVELRLNVRTFDPKVRSKILASMERIIKAECQASGVIRDPKIEVTRRMPLTVNDDHLSEEIRKSFSEHFGPNDTWKSEVLTASEDFSNLAIPIGVPHVFWNFGGVDAATWDDAERRKDLDSIVRAHSRFYAPVIEPTLKTGVDAIALAALTFLDKDAGRVEGT